MKTLLTGLFLLAQALAQISSTAPQSPYIVTTLPTSCLPGSIYSLKVGTGAAAIYTLYACNGNGLTLSNVAGSVVNLPLAQTDVTGLPAALTATEKTANKGTVNGYAGLDGTGKVPASQLPASGTAALPATVQYASKLTGASLDVDVTTGLKIGGGSATDNLTAANAFLATVSPTNPIIPEPQIPLKKRPILATVALDED